MRILLTNDTLAVRGGTDLYIRDVAIELMRRGHQPVVYSTHLGDVAQEIRGATVPVLNSITSLGQAPDVIHAQHQYDTLTAMQRFPDTPVVSFCHGWVPWEEAPLRFPQIVRYVAISEVCRERLIAEGGIAPERIDAVYNFFNRDLFPPRPALPERPLRALCLSNALTAGSLEVLRQACATNGIQFEARGRASGRPVLQPGPLLAEYDLVFARGRSAIEALAVGAAVILCDEGRAGPLVTSANVAALRPLNFALRALCDPLTVDWVATQVSRYNAADATAVSAWVRGRCEMRPAVDRLLEVYSRAIDEFRSGDPICPDCRSKALVQFLEEAAPNYKLSILSEERQKWMAAEAQHQQALEFERQSYSLRLKQAEAELAALRASASWRWSQRVLRNRIVSRLCGRWIRSVASRR